MAPPLLELAGVTVRLNGVKVLDGISLSILPGQVLGVIGPNGAGKTTLFNVVCGFVRAESGSVIWKGRNLLRHQTHSLAELGIARTLQGLGLFPGLTVVENVMAGATAHARAGLLSALLALRRADRDEAALRARAGERLAALGIGDTADRMPGELPYGIRKRVALARALVAEPELLLLDEPAAGLSSAEIQELAELLPSLEASVVLVEHRMDLVMRVCDNVAVLNFGKLIAHGPPDVVRNDAEVVQAYLGKGVGGSSA
ncbi:ABC transporter ATP-binding protein [Streptomyces sp. NBC_01017]|uniref:ABC transporter ATP-binding protein n=1 Tax=Streptomyces sp. NBC_01017 TaxID=2903721 RepID=UPI00386A6F35|nr:ABC transporter ATP-binding protein [Streptomyces sp. NBC_01017]WSV34950.1 ABC transporter ATP-binding protein [Streptomyces sp. NBC_01017]